MLPKRRTTRGTGRGKTRPRQLHNPGWNLGIDELVLRGQTSLMDALYVGAEIEEYDIRDIALIVDSPMQRRCGNNGSGEAKRHCKNGSKLLPGLCGPGFSYSTRVYL